MPRRNLSSRVLVATEFGRLVEADGVAEETIFVTSAFVLTGAGPAAAKSAAGKRQMSSPSNRAARTSRLLARGRLNIGAIRWRIRPIDLEPISQGQSHAILGVIAVGELRVPDGESVSERS